MKPTKAWTWALTAAGILQIGMALAHFTLPTTFDWTNAGTSLPPILLWALLTLNFSWSALVLIIGGLIIYAGRRDPHAAFVRPLVLMVGVFWTMHAIYILMHPMPLPPRLAWIHGPIVAFPATLILLHGIALISTKRRVGITVRVAV
jgi:hypothetical protein